MDWSLIFVLIIEALCFNAQLAGWSLISFDIAEIVAGMPAHLHIGVEEILIRFFPNS